MIKKDNTVYIWDEAQKQGFSYDIPTVENLQKDVGQNVDQWADLQEWAEETNRQYEIDCEQSSVSDDLFNPPDDVEFQDPTSLIESAQQMQDSLQDGATPEQFQDQMEDVTDQLKDFQMPSGQ